MSRSSALLRLCARAAGAVWAAEEGAGLVLSFSLPGPQGEELPPHLSSGVFLADSRPFVHVMGPHSQPVCALMWRPDSSGVLGLWSGKAHSFILRALATLPISWEFRGASRVLEIILAAGQCRCESLGVSGPLSSHLKRGFAWAVCTAASCLGRCLRQSAVWSLCLLTRSELPREDGVQNVPADRC